MIGWTNCILGKKKLKSTAKTINIYLVTPDVDNELFDLNQPEKKRKWRIILPYECDAVFVYSYEGKVYEEDNFYVFDEYLKGYVKSLVRKEKQ